MSPTTAGCASKNQMIVRNDMITAKITPPSADYYKVVEVPVTEEMSGPEWEACIDENHLEYDMCSLNNSAASTRP